MPTADDEGRVELAKGNGEKPTAAEPEGFWSSPIGDNAWVVRWTSPSRGPRLGSWRRTNCWPRARAIGPHGRGAGGVDGVGGVSSHAMDEALALLGEVLGLELYGPLNIFAGDMLMCGVPADDDAGMSCSSPHFTPIDGLRLKLVKIVDVAEMWDKSGGYRYQGTFPLSP